MRSVGLSLLLLCGVAHAETKNRSTELFEQGRALAAAGKLSEACAKFDESYADDPAPGTALNYGDCLEKLGQLRRAWKMFDAANKNFTRDSDGRADYAKTRADQVATKLAAITVKVADPAIPGLVIEIGGQPVTPAALIEDRFEPGDVTVTATAPGKSEFSTSVNGLAGSSVSVEVPAELGGAGGAQTFTTDHAERGRDKSRVRLAIITGGVGIASFATSLILGASAKSRYDDGLEDCPRNSEGKPACATAAQLQVLDDAAGRANIATGFAVAGGALIAAGVILYFTAPRESLQVAPTASSESIGLSLSGAF